MFTWANESTVVVEWNSPHVRSMNLCAIAGLYSWHDVIACLITLIASVWAAQYEALATEPYANFQLVLCKSSASTETNNTALFQYKVNLSLDPSHIL